MKKTKKQATKAQVADGMPGKILTAIRKAGKTGVSVEALAEQFDVTTRSIYRYLKSVSKIATIASIRRGNAVCYFEV